MSEFFVKLTCINQTPVYIEHKSCSKGGLIKTGLTYELNKKQSDCTKGQKYVFSIFVLNECHHAPKLCTKYLKHMCFQSFD